MLELLYQDGLAFVGHIDTGAPHLIAGAQWGDGEPIPFPRHRRFPPLQRRALDAGHGGRHL